MSLLELDMVVPVIAGLDAASVARLFDDDLSAISLPTASVKMSGIRFGLDSDQSLSSVVSHRSTLLKTFLSNASAIIGTHAHDASPQAVRFTALAGDSHNGGQRPLLFHLPDRAMVLKFADPRPYLLLAQLLGQLSSATGVDVVPPPIITDAANGWYMVPYIERRPSVFYNVDQFMFSMGVLTALAYCLRMSDLHFENVIADGAKPTIIDPECIFCELASGSPAKRLRETGLVSSNALFSGLRGGDVDNVPMFNLDLARNGDGVLDYRKPTSGFRNKIRKPATLDLADPADHRDTVIAGYSLAYRWFVRNKDLICDIIGDLVDDDFRIRFLYRNTRHYAAMVHILNLPCLYGRDIWRAGLFERFRTSASFAPRPSRKAVTAEWNDLQARDIPYFWVQAGDTAIRHKSGIVQRLARQESPRVRAINDIRALSCDDLDEQLAVLNEFFDIDLSGKARAA